MNRLILSEVKRIHEIMGLSSSNLIIESKSALIKDLLGDLVNRAMGAFDKNLIRGVGRISRETFEDRLNQVYNRLDQGLPLSPAERKFFSSVVQKVAPDIPTRLYNDFIGPSIDEIGKSIPSLGRANFERAIKNKKFSDDDVVKKMGDAYKIGQPDSLIPDMTLDDLMALRKFFKNDADEIIKPPKKRPTPPDDVTPEPKPDDVTPVDDVTTDLASTSDFINRNYDDIPGMTEKELERLSKLNRGGFTGLRKLQKSILDFFTSQDKKLDECIKLIRNYNSLNSQQQTDAFKRIQELLVDLTRSEKNILSDIDNFINKEIRPYMQTGGLETAMKIKSGDGWALAKSLMDGSLEKEYKEKFPTWFQRKGMLRNQLISVFSPFSWMRAMNKKYAKGGSYWDAVTNKWKDIVSGSDYAQFREYFKRGTTMSREQWQAYVKLKGLPAALANIPLEWAKSYLLYTTLITMYNFITGILSDVLDIQGEYPVLSGEKNKEWDELMKIDPSLKSNNSWISALQGIWTGAEGVTKYFLDSLSPGLGIPPLSFKLAYGFNELFRGTETREGIKETKDRFLNLLKSLSNWGEETVQAASEEIRDIETNIDYPSSEIGFRGWATANRKEFSGFSDITKRGHTLDGTIYYQIDPGKKGYVVYTPQVKNVYELKSLIPALEGNKSSIVRNPDGSFTETLSLNPNAPHITQDMVGDYIIDVKNGKAYYISALGKAIEPFELKQQTTNQQ